MSSLVSLILFVALVATSICVVTMYRKLKQLEAYHAEYRLMVDQTSHALSSASEAVRSFNSEGRDILQALGSRIEEAQAVMAQLADATQASKAPVRAASALENDGRHLTACSERPKTLI